MTTPAWCPNFGVECEHPDCTLLEAECATAEAAAMAKDDRGAWITAVESSLARKSPDVELPQVVRVVPPTKPGELPTLFPITADEIFRK